MYYYEISINENYPKYVFKANRKYTVDNLDYMLMLGTKWAQKKLIYSPSNEVPYTIMEALTHKFDLKLLHVTDMISHTINNDEFGVQYTGNTLIEAKTVLQWPPLDK